VDFYRPRSGLNQRTLGPIANTLTTTPPMTTFTFKIILNKRVQLSEVNRLLDTTCYFYVVTMINFTLDSM
jgi:hypothetical protein